MTAETSIYEYAKQGLQYGSERTAIWFYGKSISYGELFEKIDNVADHLYALGVREGSVVTIHLPNCPQAVMAIYAVAKLGGICNMVHPLTPEAALRDSMTWTESAVLITHLPLSGEHEIQMAQFAELEAPCGKKAAVPEQTLLATACAFYLHSSGTTGKPKTIMLSHSAVNHCVENTADFFENGDMAEQVSLGVLPLFHGFGLAADVHRNIRFGSQLVIMPRWNAREAVQLIKRHRVTLMVGVPAMYYSLLCEPDFRGEGISQLAYCYTGGDTVSPELVAQMDARTGRERCMLPGFGLTEATTMNCVSTFCHYRSGSAGYPVRNTAIAVLDGKGNLQFSGKGELVISSPTLMMGYYKDPEATERTLFTVDGKLWTRTGDEVEIDGDGFLFFRDRIKNIIIHNGYNIYPCQVEDVIRSVSGVENVCVVGFANTETHTQDIRAFVISSTGDIEQEIRAECLKRLPRYSIPREIVFKDTFPTNSMGKTDRQALS